MHRIADFRMSGISRRNFSMFCSLCGDETLGNVVIVTNMWGEVSLETGEAREHELRTNDRFFKPAIDNGARMHRHYKTIESAREILSCIVGNSPEAVRIQKELVDENKAIIETAAGTSLMSELALVRDRYRKEVETLREKMDRDTVQSARMKEMREAEIVELHKRIERVESARDQLSSRYAEALAEVHKKMRRMEEELEEKERHLQRLRRIEEARRAAARVMGVTAMTAGLLILGLRRLR